ncbi:hypothetical protein L7H23_08645 [Sphingopyxis sp. BSN-002]|uniref:hypothetical protein n=1 Tax=Sphingopyxis sp. BSN-002 TaxID=2911495 RepID=UPI001EDAB491|nr:hypothetical protein [Sphingopyxis sp. BSN-002]UKK86148.1 hypothetical protein L7H23_08645 [Sphingopyxis sp. BSN-002]
MKKVLCCSACGARLTHALTIVSSKTPGVVPPEHEDRAPLTPRGAAFKSWEPIERSFADKPASLEYAPQYWLNPDDLDGQVRDTPDARRLNGCCGLDGCDGPNQVCRCGAEVGTLRTDCWTPHVFVPDPANTNWIEEES